MCSPDSLPGIRIDWTANRRRYFHIAAAGEDCRVFRCVFWVWTCELHISRGMHRRETPEVTTGGKYPTVVAPEVWETLCVTLDDVRAWVAELALGAPNACRAEAQLYSMAASQLLPALEASQEQRKACFASAQARERERDAARQAARDGFSTAAPADGMPLVNQ